MAQPDFLSQALSYLHDPNARIHKGLREIKQDVAQPPDFGKDPIGAMQTLTGHLGDVVAGGLGDFAESQTPAIQRQAAKEGVRPAAPIPVSHFLRQVLQSQPTFRTGKPSIEAAIDAYNRGAEHPETIPKTVGNITEKGAAFLPFGPAGEMKVAELAETDAARELAPFAENVRTDTLRLFRNAPVQATDDEIDQMAMDIAHSGRTHPITVHVGKTSRNAVLDSENAALLEANIRAGKTHVPTVMVVGEHHGATLRSTIQVQRDLIPLPGRSFPPIAKPSEVFKTLTREPKRIGLSSPPKSQRRLMTHYTDTAYDEMRDPNKFPAAMVDRRLGYHFANDPAIPGNFERQTSIHDDALRPNMRQVWRPADVHMGQLVQETRNLAGLHNFGEEPHFKLESDQLDMERAMAEESFKRNPFQLQRRFEEAFGIDPDTAETLANHLSQGLSVRLPLKMDPFQNLMHMREIIREYPDIVPFDALSEQQITEATRAELESRNIHGVDYWNTAPSEVKGARDKTSTIVMPKFIEERFGEVDPATGKQMTGHEQRHRSLVEDRRQAVIRKASKQFAAGNFKGGLYEMKPAERYNAFYRMDEGLREIEAGGEKITKRAQEIAKNLRDYITVLQKHGDASLYYNQNIHQMEHVFKELHFQLQKKAPAFWKKWEHEMIGDEEEPL